MAKVVIKNLKKIYPNKRKKINKKKLTESTSNLQITPEGVIAVKDFNLEIDDNEFIVFVGPSGCGKTTTLRMIAGLEEITSGELYIDDELVNNHEPKDRNIAMVFQNYALYPHMTVYENMAFGLTNAKMDKDEIKSKIKEAAQILDIADYLDRKPKELSGGQRQRVAIGRAIVRNPKVFLMDEPLSNLDAKLRNQMRAEIIKLREKIKSTFIYVTHDQVEAMTLGDRIVIMKDGVIQQIGTPTEVYNQPANLFVASFIGTPQMNIFEKCRLFKQEGNYYVDFYGKQCQLSPEKQTYLNSINYEEPYVTVGIRPQDFTIVKNGGIETKLYVSEMMGSEMHYHLTLESKEVIAIMPISLSSEPKDLNKDLVNIDFDSSSLHIFDSKTQNNLFYLKK